MDLIGWLLRVWEPARSARCTSCGKRAKGRVLGPDSDSPAVVCENCGKRWNICVAFDSDADPYDEPDSLPECQIRSSEMAIGSRVGENPDA